MSRAEIGAKLVTFFAQFYKAIMIYNKDVGYKIVEHIASAIESM